MSKVIWYPKERRNELDHDQLVLTKCPEWCNEGFHVATWNGTEFEYRDQPNNMFDDLVTEFLILSEEGDVLEL